MLKLADGRWCGPRERPRSLGAIWLVLAAAIAGCSTSSTTQARKDAPTLRSWAAADGMRVRAWLANAVPTPYVTTSVAVAEREVEQTLQQADARSSAAGSRDVLAAGRALSAHLSFARTAIERGDRGQAQSAAPQLAADEAALAGLARWLEGERP